MSDRVPNAAADAARLASLDAYDILDTPPERGFDDIVLLARQVCSAPIALVSLVAGNRQWFKARSGFEPHETDLNASVCAHALGETDLLVIPDLTLDPRTRDNPLVTGEAHIRFYAGAPLHTPEGETLGTLCVIDHVPRAGGLSPEQAESLRALAGQVMTQLELRRALRDRDRSIAGERRGQAQTLADATRLEAMIATQQVVASLVADLDTIFRAVVDGALSVIDAASGAIIGIREGEDLVYRTTSGTACDHLGTRLPLEGTLTGRVLLTEAPQITRDAQADPDVDPALARRLGIRSMIVVPVSRQGVAIGVLKVVSGEFDAFKSRDILLAQMLAGLVGSAFGDVAETQTRHALREAESRYKAIFDSAIDFAIVTADADSRITDWNAGAQHIMGWSAGEVRGQPLHTFFTADDVAHDVPEREMHLALSNGSAMDERWHRRQNGERFWALGRMMTLHHEDGSVRGFLKILQDRTLQRKAEQDLHESEERYRTLYDSIDAGFCVIEVACDATDYPYDYRFLEVNPAFERQTGLRDVVGQWMRDLARGHEQHWFDIYARIARTGRAERFEQAAVALDERWYEVYAYPIEEPAKRYVAILFTDITARKRSEETLQLSEARWRGLFEGMQEGFFIGELIRDEAGRAVDYRFREINPAFAQQSGLSSDIVGRTIRSVLPDVEQWHIDRYAEVVETGAPTLFEIEVPQLERWFEVRARPEGHDRVAVMFLDVSARKRAETRQAALFALGDRLRSLDDSTAVARAAAEVAGETLGLALAGYGSVDPDRETINVEQDWQAPGLSSIAGLHHFREYGSYVDALKRGETVIIDDTASDPRTAADSASLAAIGVRSVVNIPLMERGRFVGLFFMLGGEPRAWTPEDTAFLRSLADRTRAAIARVEAEERQRLHNRELSHRMKNLLAMVQSIASQTMRGAINLETAKEVFSGRLLALGKAHDLLMGGALASTDIEAVMRAALAVHEDGHGRFRFAGPALDIGPQQALSLSLMLHELATNAAKYGSLSVEGHVDIRWDVVWNEPEPTLCLSWEEVGGPPVTPPTHKGFGSRFIERGLATQVGGELRLAYPPTGVTCALTAPLAAFRVHR